MRKLIGCEYSDVPQEEIDTMIAEQEAFEATAEYKLFRIKKLKEMLSETDYIACKIAEGAATKEEYEKELEERQFIREEINFLEAQIGEMLTKEADST